MRVVAESIRRVLRADVGVVDLVGIDAAGEVKVYDEIAKTNTEPPFIVWAIAPGGDSPGTYGQPYSIQFINIQVTGWQKELKLAWQLCDAAEEALEKGDYDAGDWEFMQVRRLGFAQPLPDRDTNWFQVALPLQLQFSKS